MIEIEKNDNKALKEAATMPVSWFPRYYPAIKYLGLPAGSNCLPVLQVKIGSGPKRKAKLVCSDSVEDVTDRVLATGRKNVRLTANQRFNMIAGTNSTSSKISVSTTKRRENDAENQRLDRIENAKTLLRWKIQLVLLRGG